MSRLKIQRFFSSGRDETTDDTASTISTAAWGTPSQWAAQSRAVTSPSYEMLVMQDGEASNKPSRQPPSVWSQWWVEIFSCMLMIGMLCSMIIILSLNNGKPLPDWSSTVSINTVVAVISTVLKACAALILAEGVSDAKWKWFQRSRSLYDFVLFDNASRGAWGCLQLLAAPRGGHYTASLGAGLLVLTLGLDPFTQQLLRHYDCRRVGDTARANATLPRATKYTEAAPHTGAGHWPPATPVLGFIDQGIYNPADIRTPFACVTGNCTWEQPFSTLGFCATCEDMSKQMTFVNTTRQRPTYNADTNKMETYEELWVNTTLPSGSYAASCHSRDENGSPWFVMNSTAAQGGWIDIIQASQAFPGAKPYWSLDHYYATVMRDATEHPGTGCTTAYENSTWACSGFGGAGAARCKLDPCVKTYKASVEEGLLREQLIISHMEMFVTGYENGYYYQWLAADLKCAGLDAISRLRQEGFRIENDDVIPWNVVVNSSDGTASLFAGNDPSRAVAINNVTVPGPLLNETGLPLDIIPAECIYSMEFPAVVSIREYLGAYLSGRLGPGGNGYSIDGPPQLRALYNDTFASFDSINHTFMSIAEGITQRIRRYGEPGSLPVPQPALGVVLEQRTCIDVRWPFLAFPAAVVGLTTAFLASLVGRAAFGGPSAAVAAGWKSSPLPMAFKGLRLDPGGAVGEEGSVRKREDMERVSKRVTASVSQY